MNDTLWTRMHLGEEELASTRVDTIDAPSVVRAVKRRRWARASAASVAAVALVGVGGAAVASWWPSTADLAQSPAAEAVDTPPDSAEPEPPAAVEREPYPAPEGTYDGIPALVPASQDVADRTMTPRPGPDFVVGQTRPLADIVSQAAIDACATEGCDLPTAPPATSASLADGDYTAVVAFSSYLNDGQLPYDEVDYLVALGPDAEPSMLLDLSGWAADEGLGDYFLTDLAAEGSGRYLAGVIESFVPGDWEATRESMIVMWDLDAGTSTVLAEGLDDASLEWDGDQWRVYGYGPEGTLGVAGPADGAAWSAEGMNVALGWLVSEEGPVVSLDERTMYAHRWVVGGEVYAAQPDGTLSCSRPFGIAADGSSLHVTCAIDDPEVDGSFGTFTLAAGQGWVEASDEDAALAPPARTSFAPLGDGYVLWRGGMQNTYLVGGTEQTIPGEVGEPIASGLRDGGVWTIVMDDGIGWIGPDTSFTPVFSFDPFLTTAEVHPFGERFEE